MASAISPMGLRDSLLFVRFPLGDKVVLRMVFVLIANVCSKLVAPVRIHGLGKNAVCPLERIIRVPFSPRIGAESFELSVEIRNCDSRSGSNEQMNVIEPPAELLDIGIELVSFKLHEITESFFMLPAEDEMLSHLGATDDVIEEIGVRMSLLHFGESRTDDSIDQAGPGPKGLAGSSCRNGRDNRRRAGTRIS